MRRRIVHDCERVSYGVGGQGLKTNGRNEKKRKENNQNGAFYILRAMVSRVLRYKKCLAINRFLLNQSLTMKVQFPFFFRF